MTGKGFVKDGKLKYTPDAIKALHPVILANEGKAVYISIDAESDIDYQKDMVRYYTEQILPFVFTALKTKGVSTIRQCHQIMLISFAPKFDALFDSIAFGTDVKIPLPIEDMDLHQRVKFIADIAIWAEKTFGIHFKSSTEA